MSRLYLYSVYLAKGGDEEFKKVYVVGHHISEVINMLSKFNLDYYPRMNKDLKILVATLTKTTFKEAKMTRQEVELLYEKQIRFMRKMDGLEDKESEEDD